MKIKLCGIKRPEDVAYLNEFLPDYAGFVFAGTKRRITPETAAALAEELDSGIRKVGVFVDESPEAVVFTAKAVGLDAVQLHGSETEAYIRSLRERLPGVEIWKAVRVRDEQSIPAALALSVDLLLLDSFSPKENGGTGKLANLELVRNSGIDRPYFLAGGLNIENIAGIVNEMKPFGVDISSGIETGGVKDWEKIKTIMRILRQRPESGKAGENNG